MSANTAVSEARLASLLDERDKVQELHEELLSRVDQNENKLPDEVQRGQIEDYRRRADVLDHEITTLSEAYEANKRAMETSRNVRRALAGSVEGVEATEDGIVYRSMAAYARDVILTSPGTTAGKIQAQFGSREELEAARQRLNLNREMVQRTPANTLSSNVGGLIPPQHIAQIFQVIDSSRPIVASAQRADLERGTLTYPRVDTTPVVAVQSTEKTEAGNTGMAISMQTATASTYLGGGDLSWQAVNWSTPNALDMWFRLAAADYALKTEQDAGQVISHSGFSNNIATTVSATVTYADLMTAIGAGGGEVYANSGRLADTLYVAPDRYWYAVGLTSSVALSFGQGGSLNINADAPSLRVVVSRGLDAGVMIVGDSQGLLVAETPGAPVELRVVEPAIGGYEVGIIGAFEAVVVDDGAFAMITTAS